MLMFLLVFMVAFTAAGCGGGGGGGSEPASDDEDTAESVTFRYATQHPMDHPAQAAAEAIKAEIEEKTDGRILIEIYPSNILGDWTQIYDEVMMGTIEIAHISVPEKYDARTAAGFLPYLASDFDEFAKVIEPGAFLPTIMSEIQANVGIKFFGYFAEGFAGIGLVKPATDPAVIGAEKGVLCRVPGIDAFKYPTEHLGYRTSTIPYADVFAAIQTGVVDGWMGGPPILNYMFFSDLINYYYHYSIVHEATQLLMNLDTFNALSPADQKIFEDAFLRQSSGSVDVARDLDEYYMEKMREEGIEVITFSKAELEGFARSVRENVWPRFAESYTQEFLDDLVASLN